MLSSLRRDSVSVGLRGLWETGPHETDRRRSPVDGCLDSNSAVGRYIGVTRWEVMARVSDDNRAAKSLAIFGALLTGAAGVGMAGYSVMAGKEAGAGGLRAGTQQGAGGAVAGSRGLLKQAHQRRPEDIRAHGQEPPHRHDGQVAGLGPDARRGDGFQKGLANALGCYPANGLAFVETGRNMSPRCRIGGWGR